MIYHYSSLDYIAIHLLFLNFFTKESEENGQALRKLIESKVGAVTDVVASIGGWGPTGPMLSQTVDQLHKVRYSM